MLFRMHNINKGAKTFPASTRQDNLIHRFSSHGVELAITAHNFFWDTKTDKMRTQDMHKGTRSSHDCWDLLAFYDDAWNKVRIFGTDKGLTSEQAIVSCRDTFKDALPGLAAKIKELA